MKSKDIKLYRKVLTKVNHIDYKPIDCIPSEQLKWSYNQPKSGDDDCGDGVGGGENTSPNNGSGSSENTAKETRTTTTSTKVVTKGFSIEYMSSTQLQANETLLNSCLKLFEDNMKVYYENSSWGFNLDDKKEEFVHPKAKFLLLFVNSDSEDNSSTTRTGEDNTKQLIGFVHFRYEWNDDDEPTHPVLYCYELQITKQYQRMKCCKKSTAAEAAASDADDADNSRSKSDMIGLGTYVMLVLEQIAVGGALNRIQLTCFKANEGAMNFYLNKLNYVIDEISPSKWVHLDPNNSKVDYEILSKELNVLSEAKNTAAARR